jgi:hypothetical protein
MMPGLSNERRFTDPASPAWTKATQYPVGTELTGVIEWDGMSYRSSFLVGGATVATLLAPNILPLKYPVAAIEAFNFTRDRKDLVDVMMNKIKLELEDSPGVPIEPTWEIGTDDEPSDQIHYGAGKLQRYKIKAKDDNKTLVFERK